MSDVQQVTEATIAARLERLPISSWHIKMRVILGTATFFDAFDALAIAYALPALIPQFHLAPASIGTLIGIGYAGQAIGALFFGWLGDRIGRVRTAQITIAIFGLMSFVCASAQTYDQLFWYRFVQGFGLGGEVPIAAAYISEIARADKRGPFFLFYEAIFPLGLATVALAGAYIVPRFGWQWLFVIGGIPSLVTLAMQFTCPESPRWLASKGRMAEADAALNRIETEMAKKYPLPSVLPVTALTPIARPTRWLEFLKAAIAGAHFSSGSYGFADTSWVTASPRGCRHSTVRNCIYPCRISKSQPADCWYQSRRYILLRAPVRPCRANALVHRRFSVGFQLFCVTLAYLGVENVATVAILTSAAFLCIGTTNLGLYLYTPEIYRPGCGRWALAGQPFGSALRARSAPSWLAGSCLATGWQRSF